MTRATSKWTLISMKEIVEDQRTRGNGSLLYTFRREIDINLVVPEISERRSFRSDELESPIYMLIGEHEQ
jgi:hypothetical protein